MLSLIKAWIEKNIVLVLFVIIGALVIPSTLIKLAIIVGGIGSLCYLFRDEIKAAWKATEKQ